VSLFEAQAAQAPGSPALVFGEQTLSYSELNGLSNRLAHFLRLRGVGREDLVGICLERSLEMIVAILGVLKAGGAYVPVDPGYPSERISYMLKDSGCKVLIDDSLLSEFRSSLAEYGADNLAGVNESRDLAYVIYTSGSTGKPKGVMVEHRSVVRFFENMDKRFFLEPGWVFGAVTNYTFDISVLELLGTLTRGITLSLFSQSNPLDILQAIRDKKINVLQLTPSGLTQLIETDRNDSINLIQTLKVLLIGGEPLGVGNYLKLKSGDNCKAINVYGPTETTIWSTSLLISDSTSLTIGKPLLNESIYILDAGLKLQPVGVIGEICIGGVGVARGYLNREELSAEKFIANPFKSGERLYRTGDLGRWLADGNIEYHGRLDDQVKIRGYRIELGEIESALSGHGDVSSSVVQALDLGSGERELVAYVVSDTVLNVTELRQHLQERLPGYMVPGHYVQMDSLPLTSNGKVDKKRLPSPEGHVLLGGTVYEGARNETEARLIGIWEEVLGRNGIGINDNFFDLGGHSLKAIKLKSILNKRLNLSFTIRDIYNYPTVAMLASCRKTNGNLILLNKADSSKKNVYCIPPVFGNSVLYKALAKKLESYAVCYGLQFDGLESNETFYESIEQIAKAFSEQIADKQSDEKFIILGYSMGGLIAYEIARILKPRFANFNLMLIDVSAGESPDNAEDLRDIENESEWLLKNQGQFLENTIDQLHYQRFLANNIRMSKQHKKVGKVDVDIIAYESSGANNPACMESWKNYTAKGLELNYISGDHWQAMSSENIDLFSDEIRRQLAAKSIYEMS
ncbi:amino acid adenylation domain-containing protein, partial [Mucilaginibacter angelicae]